MKASQAMFLSLLTACTLAAASARGAAIAPSLDARPAIDRDAPAARTCGTVDLSADQMAQSQKAVDMWLRRNGTNAVGGQIKVAFHVISGRNNEGDIPQSQITAQIATLNSTYAGTGYSFVLASTDRTNNRKWFGMTPGTGTELQAKAALALTPATRLNIYTCKPGQSLLGWANFPQTYPESDYRHGVVIHYGSVPGGYLTAYNEGDTAVHEVGHYLGLYHTFQGGCTAPGDYVDDTPFEATAYTGNQCNLNRDTCPSSAGFDPIKNYMDYSYDVCLNQFSAGQDVRMDAIVPVYRPSLLNAAREGIAPTASFGEVAPVTDAAARVSFRGSAPNPVLSMSMLLYSLPRAGTASIKLYSVAGRLLRTIADGDETAGEHAVAFERGELAAGMYFAVLNAGGERVTRTIILQ